MGTVKGVVAALAVVGFAASAVAQVPTDQARKDAQLHMRAAEGLMASQSWEEAAEEYRQAVALDPLEVMGYYQLGRALMAQGRPAEAQAAYESCVQALQRRNQLSEGERAKILREIDDQIHDLRDMIRRYMSDSKTIDKEKRVMEIEERIRVLERSRPMESQMTQVPAEVHLALGSALMRQNKLSEAEAQYVAAVKSDKKLGAAHNNLAVIYMLTGRFEEAHRSVKQAEKAGFPVPKALKDDIKKREAAAKAAAPKP